IPFAEPPLGDLRLQPPVLKLTPTDNISRFDATNFGPGCLQPVSLTLSSLKRPFEGLAHQPEGGIALSEDCLTINIFRPSGTKPNAKLPVVSFLFFSQECVLTPLKAVLDVTAFGESAGAIMTSILYFNSPLSNLVWGVILESGSPASPLVLNAEAREIDWQNFVGGVPSCADLATSGNTFDCIKAANTSEIFQGLLTSLSLSQEQFAFDPTIDGPDGLYPDIPSRLFAKGQFARVPFITGTNLDEGTLFTPFTINSEQQVHDSIIANFSPPIVTAQQLEATAEKLIELYPDIPALGSPFNTGNETFGLSSVFKQAAAIDSKFSFSQLHYGNFSQSQQHHDGLLDLVRNESRSE
ncbi:hypothetical protein C0993_005992, partial [Termitomyces sp. T159_Od127]